MHATHLYGYMASYKTAHVCVCPYKCAQNKLHTLVTNHDVMI